MIKTKKLYNPFSGVNSEFTMHETKRYTQCCLCGERTKGGNAFCIKHKNKY